MLKDVAEILVEFFGVFKYLAVLNELLDLLLVIPTFHDPSDPDDPILDKFLLVLFIFKR